MGVFLKEIDYLKNFNRKAVFGIGSTVVLPNQWIKIFGFEIKEGTIYLQESDISYSQSEIHK